LSVDPATLRAVWDSWFAFLLLKMIWVIKSKTKLTAIHWSQNISITRLHRTTADSGVKYLSKISLKYYLFFWVFLLYYLYFL
jgi:hypothetical protein